MALFRSVTVGLLGACLYFVVQLTGAGTPLEPTTTVPVAVQRFEAPVSILDVAAGVSRTTIPSLVRLAPGERIAAVDDRPTENDVVAGAMMVDRIGSGRFVDLTIESPGTTRRILVLVH